MTEARDTWSRLLDRARRDLGPHVARTWLDSINALGLTDGVLRLGVLDRFNLEWTEGKYGEFLRSLPPIVLGHPLELVLEVDTARENRPQMDFFNEPPVADKQRHQYDSNRLLLSDRYTFDQFIVGKSNEMAAAAAHAIAQAPGQVYNPYFIYGDTGLGKTHLMQAIAHDVLERHPGLRVTYLGAEQFTNEMVASIQGRTTPNFRRRFREVDLLLVDDVHFLRGKESTQEEFFHTFNTLYQSNRQIVLTSDRRPADIQGLEPRLVSRFQWGMIADLSLPDLEHRIAILRQKVSLDHLEATFPDDVIQFIAESIRSNVRELEGAVVRVLAFASLKHRPISIELAREVLSQHLKSQPSSGSPVPRVSIEQIQNVVASAWGVTSDGLRSKARTKTLTIPRQIAMHLSRDLLALQLVEIGKAFGGRDHSTVIHSLHRASQLILTDSTVQARLGDVRRQLQVAS
jgi:chromosomal replication initiator protein